MWVGRQAPSTLTDALFGPTATDAAVRVNLRALSVILYFTIGCTRVYSPFRSFNRPTFLVACTTSSTTADCKTRRTTRLLQLSDRELHSRLRPFCSSFPCPFAFFHSIFHVSPLSSLGSFCALLVEDQFPDSPSYVALLQNMHKSIASQLSS